MPLASSKDLFEACKYAVALEKAGYQNVYLDIGEGVVHIYGWKVPARRKKV